MLIIPRSRPHPTAMMLAVMAGSAISQAEGAERFQKLTEPQIVETLAGKQFTDKVHSREVFEHDGALRNYGLGHERSGTWRVEHGQLCLIFPAEKAFDCYEVWMEGKTLELRHDAEDLNPITGIVENRTDPPKAAMKKGRTRGRCNGEEHE
jgi:hypothetical protein